MQPTSAGYELYEASHLIREGTERVSVALEALRAGAHSPLLIRGVTAICENLLPTVLTKSLAQDPHARFDVGVCTAAEQVKLLRGGAIHLGLFFGEFSCDDLVKVLLGHGQYVLSVPHGHELAQRAGASWDDVLALKKDTIALPASGPICQPLLEAVPALKDIGDERLVLRNVQLTSYFSVQMNYVHLQDCFTASNERKTNSVVLPITPVVKFPIWAVFEERERKNSRIKGVVDHCRALIREHNERRKGDDI